MKRFRLILTVVLASALLASCTEGEGGTASITGTVIAQQLDIYGNVYQEYPAQEERIYIVYGDNEVFNDETRTHYDGKFRFDFLRAGNYTVYGYSDCPLCPGGQREVLLEVALSGGEKLDIGNLFIQKN